MTGDRFVKIIGGRPTIAVGAMRHVVTIQQQTETSPLEYDSAGPVFSWTRFVTARAAVEAIRGLDVIRSGQTTTQLYLTVAMWWQAGILPNMRVVHENGSTYVIQSVENVLEQNVVLVLNCVALGQNL